MRPDSPLKVCFCVSAFPVLSETFILNQITGLIDSGHIVHIVAERIVHESVTHPDVARYKLMEKLSLSGDSYTVLPRNKLRRVLHAFRLILSSRAAFRIELLRTLNAWRFGKEALSLNLLFRAAQARTLPFEPDVFLCHFGQNGEKMARLKALGVVPAPLVTTYHGHDLSSDLVGSGRRPYQFLFEFGDLHLPVSEHWKTLLVRLGCPEPRIAVHRMGVDVSIFKPSTDGGHSGCQILTVARLVEKKGIEFAIEAFARLADKFVNARYVIVGGGPLRSDLESKVQALNLSERIIFESEVDREGIVAHMQRSDIFMLPSITASSGDKEGIPVVLMEAMGSGLPVLSTIHSGIPELVDDGVSGLLAPEKDVEALSGHLATLLGDAELRRAMGQAARDRIVDSYSIDALNESLIGRLSALVGK